jgi:hypothetical protein
MLFQLDSLVPRLPHTVENANFSRNFRIRERYSLNIRVEFTNIFTRLQIPTTATAPDGINLGNFAQAPTKFTSGPQYRLVQRRFRHARHAAQRLCHGPARRHDRGPLPVLKWSGAGLAIQRQ